MEKVLFSFLIFSSLWGMSQPLSIQDTLKVDLPDSYYFKEADIFNSLYFISRKENSLIKYNPNTKQKYILKNFTPYKKLFIINSLFMVVLDKITQTLEFYDDKLISTQDRISILPNQIINTDLIYIQDNKLLTYFDEFTTDSFVQNEYRTNKNLVFSNSVSKRILSDCISKDVFATKYSRFLLLKKTNNPDSLNSYRIIRQNNMTGVTDMFDIQRLTDYFWNEKKLFWITDDFLYSYDFENEPEKIKLPQKGENYFILNQQLFLWKSKVMYLYKIESEN